jgi:hypothetical protein
MGTKRKGMKRFPLDQTMQKALLENLGVLEANPVDVISTLEDAINAYRFTHHATRYDLSQARSLLRRLSAVSQEAAELIERLFFTVRDERPDVETFAAETEKHPDTAFVAAARSMLHSGLPARWLTPEVISQLRSAIPLLHDISKAARSAQSALVPVPLRGKPAQITPLSERLGAQTRLIVRLGQIYWWATRKRPGWNRGTVFYRFVDLAFECAGAPVADLRDRILDARPYIESSMTGHQRPASTTNKAGQ